jgi:uncharacterized protein
MDFDTNQTAIIIFVRNPVLGKVKTRLARDIGDHKALNIYKQLLLKTLNAVKPFECKKFVFYSETIIRDDLWELDGFVKKVQSGESLGEKMKNSFSEIFLAGFKKTIIIGSDCPDLETTDLNQALLMLDSHDVALGPAMDGGYYLLGMKKMYAGLFDNKPWGTDMVLPETLHDIEASGLSFFKGRILNDIDTIEDLKGTDLEY